MKLDSIKNTAEFNFIYKNSFKSFHKYFSLYILKLDDARPSPILDILKNRAMDSRHGSLLGLSVSKKIGKATKRNLIKRRVKAIFYQADILDIAVIFVAKSGILDIEFSDLSKDIIYHLNRYKKLKK